MEKTTPRITDRPADVLTEKAYKTAITDASPTAIIYFQVNLRRRAMWLPIMPSATRLRQKNTMLDAGKMPCKPDRNNKIAAWPR
jgi:hypothetical protein